MLDWIVDNALWVISMGVAVIGIIATWFYSRRRRGRQAAKYLLSKDPEPTVEQKQTSGAGSVQVQGVHSIITVKQNPSRSALETAIREEDPKKTRKLIQIASRADVGKYDPKVKELLRKPHRPLSIFRQGPRRPASIPKKELI